MGLSWLSAGGASQHDDHKKALLSSVFREFRVR